jgi:hypothetical protein
MENGSTKRLGRSFYCEFLPTKWRPDLSLHRNSWASGRVQDLGEDHVGILGVKGVAAIVGAPHEYVGG